MNESQGFVDEITSDADCYFARNDARTTSLADDATTSALQILHSTAPIRRLLEVGAFDGRRLDYASRAFGCQALGIEASPAAVAASRVRYPTANIIQGVAPYALEQIRDAEPFDVVVLGFFLYLLPRNLLFRLASAVDALLENDGHLVVYDFLSMYPSMSEYRHTNHLLTYKFDHSRAWTWNPQYVLVHRSVHDHGGTRPWQLDRENWVTVDIVKKIAADDSYFVRSPTG